MELHTETLQALESMHIHTLTSMQSEVIEHALNKEDIFVQAPTGSGKTLAYVIPLLESITLQGKGKHFPQSLILTPTRELAQQTADVIRAMLSKREGIRTLVLCGGVDMNKQVRIASKGADIIVGTPSRILDHLRRHTFKPKLCHTLVLDEADVMLSMGFEEDVLKIKEQLPLEQIMLFSATYENSSFLSLLNHPFIYQEKSEALPASSYTAYIIEENKKPDLLKNQVSKTKGQILLFTNKRDTADFVSSLLNKNHYTSASIHSEMDMKERRRLMLAFRNQEIQILCATEVAARGIDIASLSKIICYDLPLSLTDLIHRFGRAGRMNHQAAVVLFVTPKERKNLSIIQKEFPALVTKKAGGSNHTRN